MKKLEFKEDGSLELIEVSLRRKIPKILSCPETEFDDVKIETKIYTDGEVIKIGESEIENIDAFFINGKKYTHQVDKLKRTRVYLKDYSYAVVYTLGKEYMTVGNIHGRFKVIKNIEIYLKNKKDLTALRKARKTIQMVAEYNNSIDYSSIFSMLFSKKENPKKIEYQRELPDIYTLKK